LSDPTTFESTEFEVDLENIKFDSKNDLASLLTGVDYFVSVTKRGYYLIS